MNDLATWYETGADKIAVVRGGKFVGKTWAVADFAMGFFEDHIIIDMDKYPGLCRICSKGEEAGEASCQAHNVA